MLFFRSGLIALLLCTAISANPVIYQGGRMLDTAFDSRTTDIQWAYSLTARTAAGYRYIEPESNPSLHLFQINWLINRWNEPDSQANIYLMNGVGITDTSWAGYLGTEVDWENRQFYTAASAEHFFASSPFTKITARLGAAPYLTEYEGLHTWVILQAVQVNQNTQSSIWIMPVIRLFQNNVLAEFGLNGTIYSASFRIHY